MCGWKGRRPSSPCAWATARAGPTFVEGAAVRLTRGGETLASAEAPAGAAEVTLRVEASALGGGVAAEAFAPGAAAGE